MAEIDRSVCAACGETADHAIHRNESRSSTVGPRRKHAFVPRADRVDPQPKAAEPPPEMRPPALGEVVLYTLGHGPSRGETRPALVVAEEKPGNVGALAKFVDAVAQTTRNPVMGLQAVAALAQRRTDPRLVVRVYIFTDEARDGLAAHVAPAAFSETALPWHYSLRPNLATRDDRGHPLPVKLAPLRELVCICKPVVRVVGDLQGFEPTPGCPIHDPRRAFDARSGDPT